MIGLSMAERERSPPEAVALRATRKSSRPCRASIQHKMTR